MIRCSKCKADRKVGIVKGQGRELIDWLDNNPNPQAVKIVSGRRRLDGNWGWSCICGNDDIMTNQEKQYLEKENPQEPSASNITKVVSNLIIEKPKFQMRSI